MPHSVRVDHNDPDGVTSETSPDGRGRVRISVTEAQGQLTDLVRRAEAGDEVVLTRHGQAAVKLVPVRQRPDADARRTVIARMQAAAAGKRTAGASAARSQDFLYDGDGLPK